MTSLFYFRSEVIGEKTVENTASDGLGWNFSRTAGAVIMKFYILIEDNPLHKHAGNDVTSCFRLAFIEVRKMPHPTSVFAPSIMQCQALEICSAKSVFKFLV